MQSAVFAGAFDVPLVMVSGDESACNEAKHFISGVYTASVKTATERNSAVCIDEKTATERIYNAVKSGVENFDKIKPIKMELPFTVRIEFNRSDYCDEACRSNPNIKRLDVYNAESVKTEIKEWKDVLL
jgi:D-amino peptidase